MRWVINIASNYLRFLVGMVVVFFLTPYIVSRIGIELFGLWSLIFAVVGLFGLLDLGFATAAVKYVAELTASKDRAARNQVLATLVAVYSGLGLVCLAGVGSLAGTAPLWFDLTTDQAQAFTTVLWLLGTAVALGLPLSVFKAILVGSGRMSLVNGVELGVTLANAALIVALLETGYGLLGLGIATATTMLLATLLLIPFAYRLTPELSLSPRWFAAARVRELTGYSVYFFIANVAVLVILRIDPVVIKAFLPLSAVAVYAIAAKVSEYTYLLNKQFSNALMPLVSQSRGAGDNATVQRVLVDGTRFLMAIALPFVALLFFYADDIVVLWMGQEFAASAPLLRILLVAVLFTSVQMNAANVLGMSGHHRFVAFAMGGAALLNLVLSILLIQQLGLTGVAIATLLAALLVETLIIVPVACARQGIPLSGFLSGAVLPTLPGLLPALGAAYLLQWWQPTDSFARVFGQGAVCALVYFAVFYATGLQPGERQLLRERLRGLRRARTDTRTDTPSATRPAHAASSPMRTVLQLFKRALRQPRQMAHRLRLESLGAGCEIDAGVSLQYPDRIRIGDGVRIGRNATLRANTEQRPGITLGRGVWIQDAVVVNANRGSVVLGDRSWLGPFCLVYGNGGVSIGANVLVAGHTSINTVYHESTRCDVPINDQAVLTGPVVIEDDVWIGLNAVVLQGVTIGRGAIVGAGAVVTRSIPAWSIAVGVPARVIGRRGCAPPLEAESAPATGPSA